MSKRENDILAFLGLTIITVIILMIVVIVKLI